jgi:hypothetical protein
MYKVSGASRTQTPSGAGRSRSVKTDGDNVVKRNTSPVAGDLETIRDLLQADLWALL